MKLKYKLINWLVPFVFKFFSLLPLSFMQALGFGIGFILSFFPNQLVRVAERNIDLCYPELSLLQKRKLVRQTVIQTVISGAEMPAIFMKDLKKVLKTIKNDDNLLKLKEAYAKGNGLLFIGPHLGCWEVAGLYVSANLPAFTLYTPPKQKALGDLILKGRERTGGDMEPASQSGVRHLFKALKDNKAVAMLTDQVPDPDDFGGLYAPFFGIDAWTMSFPSKLYQKRTPPTFMIYAIRLGIGRGFKLVIEPFEPYLKAYKKNNPNCPDPFTFAMNAYYEEVAKTYPSQYQWTYRRFKYPPKGHPGLYL